MCIFCFVTTFSNADLFSNNTVSFMADVTSASSSENLLSGLGYSANGIFVLPNKAVCFFNNWCMKPATMARPCAQNVPKKIDQASPAGCTHRKAAQRSVKDQVVWFHLRPDFVPSWCGASGAIRGFWKPRALRGPLGMLPPRSPDVKMNENFQTSSSRVIANKLTQKLAFFIH